MVLCIAQFSYGAPCRYNAKYGQFCGRHRPKEERIVVYCKYISECGKQCKMSVSGVEHCFKHRLPLADNKQWKVYSPDVGWPYMGQVTQILRNNHRKDCLKDLHKQYINFIEHKRNIPLIYSIDLVDTKLENLTTIIVTELFFQHFYLKFEFSKSITVNLIFLFFFGAVFKVQSSKFNPNFYC